MAMLNPELVGRPRLELDHNGKAASQPSPPSVPPTDLTIPPRVGYASPAAHVTCTDCGRPRAACYVRLCVPGQGDGTSLEWEEKWCRTLAEHQGYCVERRHIFRETYTAAELERPELDRLMAVVRASVVAAVFVYHPDRWSRVPLHAFLMMAKLREHKVQLIFVKGDLENTPEILLDPYVPWFARQRRQLQFIDRSRTGKTAGAGLGRVPNGTGACLYGYDHDSVIEVPVVNEQGANTVREVFMWASKGVGMRQIVSLLNEQGFPSKTDARWHSVSVRRILQNRAYTGVQS